MSNKNKTVFFLGSGFSKDAGAPVQKEMIANIFAPDFISDMGEQARRELGSFKKFLSQELYLNAKDYENISLEDVFTPIDRCIADGKSLGHYSYKQLIDLRERFHNLLGRSIEYGIENKCVTNEYILKFANYVNELAKVRVSHPEVDRVAVVTTNWDMLLDRAFFYLARRETELLKRQNPKDDPTVVVDYCCYISSLEEDKYIKPGLYALGQNGYNIKYLKLHGSMNWLHCPYCQRLYVKFDEKTMFETRYCRHCRENFGFRGNSDSIKLRANLLLPTFLKDMKDVQTQLVWQNAAMELSEADRVVFIGYSLPAADFEIRQLLSRFISHDTLIDVVLYPGSPTLEEASLRYRRFFGRRRTRILVQTVPEYVDALVAGGAEVIAGAGPSSPAPSAAPVSE